MPLLLGVVALPLWHPTPLQRVSPSPDVCSAPAGPKSVDCQRDLWAECRLVQVWNKTDTFLRQKGIQVHRAHTPHVPAHWGREGGQCGWPVPPSEGRSPRCFLLRALVCGGPAEFSWCPRPHSGNAAARQAVGWVPVQPGRGGRGGRGPRAAVPGSPSFPAVQKSAI